MKRYERCGKDVVALIEAVRDVYYPSLVDAKFVAIFDLRKVRYGMHVPYAKIKPFSAIEKCAGIKEDILVIITKELWDRLRRKQKKALIDHELAHIRVKEKGGKKLYRLTKHDVEEFVAVVRRRGAWSEELKLLKKNFKKKKE